MNGHTLLSMVKEMVLNTSVSAGKIDAFKAAFSRSVLGVTYKKYKRKGRPFFNNRKHNEEITKKSFEYIYLLLRKEYDIMLNDYDIRVKYTIGWDENDGKILYFKDLETNCYLKVCDLMIDKLELTQSESSVDIKIFYSNVDRGSKKLLSYIDDVLGEYENINITKSMHCVDDYDYEEISKIYHVEFVPTIVIDGLIMDNIAPVDIKNKLDNVLNRRILPPQTRLETNNLIKQALSKVKENNIEI